MEDETDNERIEREAELVDTGEISLNVEFSLEVQ